MKSRFLARHIPRRWNCRFNDKQTDIRFPFRPADENFSHQPRRGTLTPRSLIWALLLCLLLMACGGGGGGMSAGGGIDGTGIMSAGVVSAFGSIVVNGTEFDTRQAEVFINGEKIGDGDDAVLDNLDIGMVVRVEGRLNRDGSAVADRVIYSANVIGPVESVQVIDATTKALVVLGQTVIVNVITKFADTDGFDSIALDDVVEVSGYVDDSGAIRATFLEKTGDITTILEYEVTGIVENLVDSGFTKTFMINGLTVNYALVANVLPAGIPAEGLWVEVDGTLAAPGGEVVASAIELADELAGEDGNEFEIMGYVTEIISYADIIEFKVGNQVVHADPDMVLFVDGVAGDIAPGVKLEAEGSLEGGIIYADEIEFWKPDQVEVEGVVTNIVSAAEFYVGIRRVQTNQDTLFDGGEPDDLAWGVRIEVKGVPLDLDHSVIMADKVSFETD